MLPKEYVDNLLSFAVDFQKFPPIIGIALQEYSFNDSDTLLTGIVLYYSTS